MVGILRCVEVSITTNASPHPPDYIASTTTHRNVIIGECFDSHGISFAVASGSLNSWKVRVPSSSSGYKPVSGSLFGTFSASSAISMAASPTWSLDESLSQSRTVSCTRNDRSYLRTWKSSFSSQTGFSECRITRVRKTFLPNETTTKGSISHPVRITCPI
jgi:hypothetical protein